MLCLVLRSKGNPNSGKLFQGTVSYCSLFISLSEVLVPCRQLCFCVTSYFGRENRGSISFLRQLLTWVSFTSRVLPAACRFCALPDLSHLGADLHLHSCPCPTLGAFCCLHPVHVPFISPLLPSSPCSCMGLKQGISATLWKQGMNTCLAEVEAWRKNCTAPFLTQGEEKMFLLAFVFPKPAG